MRRSPDGTGGTDMRKKNAGALFMDFQISPDDRATNDDGLREFLAARIVRYKIPRSFEFTDAPLRDDAGKARRSQLVNDRIDRPL